MRPFFVYAIHFWILFSSYMRDAAVFSQSAYATVLFLRRVYMRPSKFSDIRGNSNVYYSTVESLFWIRWVREKFCIVSCFSTSSSILHPLPPPPPSPLPLLPLLPPPPTTSLYMLWITVGWFICLNHNWEREACFKGGLNNWAGSGN